MTEGRRERENFSAYLEGADLERARNAMLRAGFRTKSEFVRHSVLSGNVAQLLVVNDRIGRLGMACNDLLDACRNSGSEWDVRTKVEKLLKVMHDVTRIR